MTEKIGAAEYEALTRKQGKSRKGATGQGRWECDRCGMTIIGSEQGAERHARSHGGGVRLACILSTVTPVPGSSNEKPSPTPDAA